jgi:argininosuccinate lyase
MSVEHHRTGLQEFLHVRDVAGAALIETGKDMPTVPRAAEALGVAPEQVVKSIVLQHKKDPNRVCLAVLCGEARADLAKVARAAGLTQLKLASPATTLAATGYAVGGVPPVGHHKALPVVLDSRVMDHAVVFGGGGDERHMLRISPGEIRRLTNAVVADITVGPGVRKRPDAAAGGIGRLSRGPDPLLFELLYEPQLARDRHGALPYLLRIDAAHVLMLGRRGLISPSVAASLLAVNGDLRRRASSGEDVIGSPPTHRGLYFLYERTYVERLGEQVGGAAHLARSRNDINATVTRLRLRDELDRVLSDFQALLAAMQGLARPHLATVMCGFTHQQPAQPTTLAHYLAGVLSELTRSAEWLEECVALVNRSPMGAAAGFGTSLPIDPTEVAEALGFDAVIENSADAVASRDYVVRVCSALTLTGLSLTRLATDLQAWASPPFHFFAWPDELVSTSSMMPQKRNPFVLEVVRGRCARVAGALVQAVVGMKNVPFSNSVEISSEATAALWPAVEAMRDALRLSTLLLGRVHVDSERMARALQGQQTSMTAMADLLARRYGLTFRTSHEAVARLAQQDRDLSSAAEVGEALRSILGEVLGQAPALDERAIAECLDPVACVGAATFGGGPSPAAVGEQLRSLAERERRLAGRMDTRRQKWRECEARLTAEVTDAGALPAPGD